MSHQETSQEQDVPKSHVHIDDSHEALADSIHATVSAHLHENQLVPGNSILNEHIREGRIPGGAEGEAIKKKKAKDEEEKKKFETHIVK